MFKNIKKNWQKKIEKNAFKSHLTYVDRKGKEHTEEVYFKRSLMPLGDWQRIYPPIGEDGKLNWTNLLFGGKKNLIKTLIILGIVLMILFQMYENFKYTEELRTICMPYLENSFIKI